MAKDRDHDRDPLEPFDDDGVPAEPRRPASRPDFPGRELFRGSPRAILRRLLDGDPLELSARAAERLRRRALLLEHERVTLRSMARVAHAGPTYRGEPPLDEWLVTRIDDAIVDLVHEDEEAEHGGLPPEEPFEERLLFISEITGLAPSQARTACLRFNALPEATRLAFFEVVVWQKRFNRYVAEGHGPPTELQERLMAAFRALSLPLGDGFGDFGEVQP